MSARRPKCARRFRAVQQRVEHRRRVALRRDDRCATAELVPVRGLNLPYLCVRLADARLVEWFPGLVPDFSDGRLIFRRGPRLWPERVWELSAQVVHLADWQHKPLYSTVELSR